MLAIGSPAPDLLLNDENGIPVRLSDRWSKAQLVLFFYPKDDTPGCVAQACAFRDEHDRLLEQGKEVIGISRDGQAPHQRFVQKYRLPFTLLSDPTGKVHKAYGVGRIFGILPERVTYLIDRDGIIIGVHKSSLSPKGHARFALGSDRG